MNPQTTGKIQPLRLERVDSLGDRRIPSCWVRTPRRVRVQEAIVEPFGMAQNDRIGADFLRAPTLALMLGATPPEVAIHVLLDAAEAGARVYVLAGPDFGEGRRDPGLRDLKRARVLVRRLPVAPPCSAILAGRGERARVWLGYPDDQQPAFSLPLSTSQGAALFAMFLHLFWHGARDEASTGQGPLDFKPAADRPFDALPPGPRSPLRRLGPEEARLAGLAGDTLHDPMGMPELQHPEALRIALLRASSSGHAPLVALAKKGTLIAWEDLGLPPFLVGEAGGAIEMGTGALRLRLTLDPSQAQALGRLARIAADVGSFRFHHETPLASLSGEVWLPNAPSPQPILDVQPLDAKPRAADALRTMHETAATSYPDPPPLALSVKYSWMVHPPRVPSSAKEDPLVASWREADARAKALLAALEARAQGIEKHAGALGRFKALAGKLLGLGRDRNALNETLGKLKASIPSTLGPEGARGLFEDIAKLESSVAEHEEDLRKEERQAEEDEEREKQEDEFKEKQRKAAQELERVKKERAEEEAKLKGALDDLAAQPFEDENKRKYTAERIKSKGEKTIRDIDARISALDAVLEEKFNFEPTRRADAGKGQGKGSGSVVSKFVPVSQTGSGEGVPREALPQVGELRRLDKTRYLVIKRWDDLADGERESERLGARLVAPEEGA